MADKLLYRWHRAFVAAPELIASDRLVALVLQDYMNGDGQSAFPAIETIVKETGLSKATVLVSLAWLQASGWVLAESRGRRSTKLYSAGIPTERKSRADRIVWVKERGDRLARTREIKKASRSKSVPAQSVETATNSDEPASRSKPSQRVGLNGEAESVEIVAQEVPRDIPNELPPEPSPTVQALERERERRLLLAEQTPKTLEALAVECERLGELDVLRLVREELDLRFKEAAA
jgi:hypothetical protein